MKRLLHLVYIMVVSACLTTVQATDWAVQNQGPQGNINLSANFPGSGNTCAKSFAVSTLGFSVQEEQDLILNLQHVVAYPASNEMMRIEFAYSETLPTLNGSPSLSQTVQANWNGQTYNFTMTPAIVSPGVWRWTGNIDLPRYEPFYQLFGEVLYLSIHRAVGFVKVLTLATQVVITGDRFRTEPIWSTVTPELPQMIIHHPPGDQSYAFIESNSEICQGYGVSLAQDASGTAWGSVRIGQTGSAGIGVTTDYDVYAQITASLEVGIRAVEENSYEMCARTTETYSTAQGNPSINGRDGDVYIGTAIRYKYGFVERVFMDNCEPIFFSDFMLVPDSTLSSFFVTEYAIKNTIIPTVVAQLAQATALGDLVTKQKMEDQLEVWHNALAMNDEIYAQADASQSFFFSGSAIGGGQSAYTVSRLQSLESNIYIEASAAVEAGATVGGTGASGGVKVRAKMDRGTTNTNGITSTNTIGYHLEDDDGGDIFNGISARDGVFGTPLFLLEDGLTETSCPYEGGYQLDQPFLEFQNGSTVDSLVDITVNQDGSATALLYVNICNESDEDRTYHLKVDQLTNTEGLEIRAFGQNLSENDLGAELLGVPAGNCIQNVPITLQHMNGNVLDYEDIELILYKTCQPATHPIESRVTFTARFSPATSTDDIPTNESSLSLSPNPNDGSFMVNLTPTNDLASLRLLDLNGRVVHEQKVAPFTEQVQVNQRSELPKGLYLVVVQQADGQQQSGRVLVQ